MSRRENLCFLTRNFQSRQNFTIKNLVFTLPLRILLKSRTLWFKIDTITTKTVSQLKCLEERKELRFTLWMKDLVLHCSVRIWDTFSEVMSVMNLEKCWEEMDLTNQNLLTTLYAYTLSWYTQIWLSTISLATQRLHCFPFISKLKSGETITTGQYMDYQTFSNLQFRPLLKNSFHSIHIELRNTSSEKILFLSVGITHLVLMFRKASNIHF